MKGYFHYKYPLHGFSPGHTSSIYRSFGAAFSFARLEFHARTFKKPSMSISSISRIRHPASSREL